MTTLQELPTDAPSRLRQALQLPLANREIAKWLFSQSTSAFHRDATPLAPASFNDSLILFIRQAIGGVDTPPIRALLLPVAVIDGIAVGYTLTHGDISDPRLHPFQHPARETAGRFAFDPLSSHIIGVSHGVSAHETGIYAVFWFRGARRQRCYISVPKREYTFENPPQTVLAMTIKNERKMASVLPEKCVVEEQPHAGFFTGDFEKVHPNVLFDYGKKGRRRVEKESGFEFRRLGGSGKMEKGSVQRWLRELESCLEGRFHSPGVTRGAGGGGDTEEITSCIFDPGEDESRLKMKAAQEYYAFVLQV